jgi:hypothetical protein
MALETGSDVKAAERLEQDVGKQGCGQAMTVLTGGGEITLGHVSSSNSQRLKPFEGWPKARFFRSLQATVKALAQ